MQLYVVFSYKLVKLYFGKKIILKKKCKCDATKVLVHIPCHCRKGMMLNWSDMILKVLMEKWFWWFHQCHIQNYFTPNVFKFFENQYGAVVLPAGVRCAIIGWSLGQNCVQSTQWFCKSWQINQHCCIMLFLSTMVFFLWERVFIHHI